MIKKFSFYLFLCLPILQSCDGATTRVESEDETVQSVFDKIYDEGKWGKDEDGSGNSGPGSDPRKAEPYLVFLNNFIKTNNIRTIIDVGCGDWRLMRHVDLTGIDYTGYDVAKAVVEKNQNEFGASNIRFILTPDATESELPVADLLIIKEVLQHLPNQKVHPFLKKMGRFKHVLLANDMVKDDPSKNNYDIKVGGWRPLDLQADPFGLHAEEVLYYHSNYMIQVLHVNNSIN